MHALQARASGVIAKRQKEQVNENLIKVYPNPSKDYIIVEYRMKLIGATAYLAITDMTGKEIKKIHLEQNSGYKVISCNNLAPGSYACSLMLNNSIGAVAKFIVKQ